MKTAKCAALLFLTAFSAAAQGTVRFDNNIPGVLVSHVYANNPFFGVRAFGNGPSDFPAGNMNWEGWPLVAGSGFSAQILAAPGADANYSSLKPASPITTFQTGANAGFFAPLVATLEGIPADAPVASVGIVAWDNQNGTINSWEEAFFHSPTQWGGVVTFNVYNIGGAVNPPPVLTGLVSFGMAEVIVPEPSSLGLLGCGMLLVGVVYLRTRPAAWRSRTNR